MYLKAVLIYAAACFPSTVWAEELANRGRDERRDHHRRRSLTHRFSDNDECQDDFPDACPECIGRGSRRTHRAGDTLQAVLATLLDRLRPRTVFVTRDTQETTAGMTQQQKQDRIITMFIQCWSASFFAINHSMFHPSAIRVEIGVSRIRSTMQAAAPILTASTRHQHSEPTRPWFLQTRRTSYRHHLYLHRQSKSLLHQDTSKLEGTDPH